MPALRKARTALEILKNDGFKGIASILRSQYGLPIPQSKKSKWKAGIKSEIEFWDAWFRTKGLQWADASLISGQAPDQVGRC